MAGKYIDLVDKISDVLEPGLAGYAYIRNALLWLDQNHDQVPGPTMTESEMEHKCATYGSAYETGFKQAGGQIVPDPEPTNAEKLERIWADWDPTREGVWEFFDRRGVKAPGGDDDR